MTENAIALMVLLAVLIATAVAVSLYIYYGRLIMRSRMVGAPVDFRRMLRMTMSGLDAYRIVNAYLDARRAGIDVSLDRLEQMARERENVKAVVKRLIGAKVAGQTLSLDDALQNNGQQR